MKYDVIVVGASVGGCTAAILYARHGLNVALVERSTDPAHYKKLCTHYLQPAAVDTIRRLGLTELIEEAGEAFHLRRSLLVVIAEHGERPGLDAEALGVMH